MIAKLLSNSCQRVLANGSKPLFINRFSAQAQASYSSHGKGIRKKRKPPVTIQEKTAEEAVTNILYETPNPDSTPTKRHLINCLVANEPGVLSRVSGILAARNFNIDSIICAKTDIPTLSRMTIVLIESPFVVKQAIQQLEDLVPVWAVLDYTGNKILERELLMAKISLHGPHYHEDHELPTQSQSLLQASSTLTTLSELTKLFQGRVLDVSSETMIIELSAKCTRIEAFLALLKPYGVLEAARSGAMVMPRSLMDDQFDSPKDETDSSTQIDVSSLPPG